jgi:hypothetical protein
MKEIQDLLDALPYWLLFVLPLFIALSPYNPVSSKLSSFVSGVSQSRRKLGKTELFKVSGSAAKKFLRVAKANGRLATMLSCAHSRLFRGPFFKNP